MTPTETLTAEHEGIKVMLGILGKVCDRLDAGKAVDPAHLERILEFLKVFVDTCHHAKEEDFLFPALEKAGIPRERGPIGVMLHEHEEGRGRIREMAAEAEGYARGERGAAARFAKSARAYTALLLDHIDKEDNILYPMGEARLGEAERRKLLEEFDRVEEERVGHGRHEAFHRMMDELKAIYSAAA